MQIGHSARAVRALVSATNKTASVPQPPIVGSGSWAAHRGGLTVEDGRSLDVAYPRSMSDIPQLLAAIDSRLADLAAEITVLETAKAALDGPRTIGRRRQRRHDRTLASSPETPSPNAFTQAHRTGRLRHNARASYIRA